MLQSVVRLAEVAGLVASVLVVAIVAVALWSRRGDRRPDSPGVRTFATFRGGKRYVAPGERQALWESGVPVGEGVLQALAGELRRLGCSVTDVDQHESSRGPCRSSAAARRRT